MTDTTSTTRTPSQWRFWLPRLGFAIAAPVLLLVLIEGALRLFHVGYSTRLMEPCTIHGRSSSCYNLFFAAPFFPPGMIKTPQFFSISPQKPQHTYRIFVLGESAAMGDPDPAYGFSRYIEVMLRERLPGTKFEIVNTGMVAINSHVSLIMARELANYKPDLFLVYAGSNEVVGPYGPGTVLTASSMSMPVIRASIFVRSSRIGQLLSDIGKRRVEWRGMEMFLDKQVRADSPRLEPAYQNFASNLKSIVDIAHDSGARVLLSTIASNLRNSAPFASLHRRGLSAEALGSWSSLVQQGAALENAGAYSDALKLYTAAARVDDQFAELHFRMARRHWALGDFGAAKEHYVRARDLDTLRFRADSRINEVIRSVGSSSGQVVKLLDAESLLAGESHNGVIGGELLYDHVHFTPLGSYLLARAAFQQIVSVLPADVRSSAQSSEPLSEAECERLLAFTGHDRARVAAEMVDRLQRPPFTQQLNHLEQLQSLMFRASGTTESVQDAVSQYQWAIEQHPDDLTLHYKFGLFLFNYDRNAAAQELILARPNDEFPVYLPDGTRVL
ncbi:MAG TPA: bacterial transcriptional activator domain-containing protein [Candidatus Sulfotelmatobacter sp.]|nr:bacterial transcriptional activator domain-containing protein [Candidatus Sulfotelmatobacter sp.]